MKNISLIVLGFVLALLLGFYPHSELELNKDENLLKKTKSEKMKLGAFAISLSVKDIRASKQFYENLGFSVLGGDLEKNYLIMKNETAIIGLFQGMFDNNILTFNPGWDENGNNIESFNDIREIQENFKNQGISIDNEIDPRSDGPASFTITDPDGNVILFDQHR